MFIYLLGLILELICLAFLCFPMKIHLRIVASVEIVNLHVPHHWHRCLHNVLQKLEACLAWRQGSSDSAMESVG